MTAPCSSCGVAVRVELDVCPRCGDLVDLYVRDVTTSTKTSQAITAKS